MTNMTEHPSHGRTPDSGRDDAPAAFLWLLLGTWSLFLLFAGWMIGGHLPGTYVVAGALLLMLGLGDVRLAAVLGLRCSSFPRNDGAGLVA